MTKTELEVEVCQLRGEIKVLNALLEGRQKVLNAIPKCSLHGACVPHALDSIECVKALLPHEKCQS